MFAFYSLLLLHITAVLMTFTFCLILHRFYCRIYRFWIFIIILKLMFWIFFTCYVLKWNDTRVILPQHHQEIHNTNTRIGIALRKISWLKQCAWARTQWHTTCKFCCLHRAVLVLMINEYDIFREDQKGSYFQQNLCRIQYEILGITVAVSLYLCGYFSKILVLLWMVFQTNFKR